MNIEYIILIKVFGKSTIINEQFFFCNFNNIFNRFGFKFLTEYNIYLLLHNIICRYLLYNTLCRYIVHVFPSIIITIIIILV